MLTTSGSGFIDVIAGFASRPLMFPCLPFSVQNIFFPWQFGKQYPSFSYFTFASKDLKGVQLLLPLLHNG